MRRHRSLVSRCVAVVGAIALAAGCKGVPTRSTPVVTTARGEPTTSSTPLPPGASPIATLAPVQSVLHASTAPIVLPPPTITTATSAAAAIHGTVLVPPAVISHNGGNVISHNGGNVISHNGGNVVSNNGGSVISHNGGNATGDDTSGIINNNGSDVISHNGGNIVSNNGGNVISHNGGNFTLQEVPLPHATVTLTDAAGVPVKGPDGKPIQTQTDDKGNYAFPVNVSGRNLVVHVAVDGQTDDLVGLLPKASQTSSPVDVDISTSMSLGYVLKRYVNGNDANFDRLTPDALAKAVSALQDVLSTKQTDIPAVIDDQAFTTIIDGLRTASQPLNDSFEQVRKEVVIAGIANEQDGKIGLQTDLGFLDGGTVGKDGSIYLFSRGRHTLWRQDPQGVLHTMVAGGNWPYKDVVQESSDPECNYGLAVDDAGYVFLADRLSNRIVRVSPAGEVVVLCGTGEAGYSGDGGLATAAKISSPAGLALDAKGTIYFSDQGNNCIRRIADGKISTLLADPSIHSGAQIPAKLVKPQGIAIADDGGLIIADSAQNQLVFTDPQRSSIARTLKLDGTVKAPIAVAEYHARLFVADVQGNKLFSVAEDQIDNWSTSASTEQINADVTEPLFLAATANELIFHDSGQFVSARVADAEFAIVTGSAYAADGQQLDGATAMTLDSHDNLYVSDTAGDAIFRVPSGGNPVRIAGIGGDSTDTALVENGLGDYSAASKAPVVHPGPIVFLEKTGELVFVQAWGRQVLRAVTADGRLTTFLDPTDPSRLAPDVRDSLAYQDDIRSMAALPDGDVVFNHSRGPFVIGTDGVVRFLPGHSQFHGTVCFTVDRNGTLWGIDVLRRSVVHYQNDTFTVALDGSRVSSYMDLGKATALAIDSSGQMYISDETHVISISSDGKVRILAGQNGAYFAGDSRDDSLFYVTALDFDSKGTLLILDRYQVKALEAEQLTN